MKAICTWGDGPDVLLILDGKPIALYEDPTNLDKFTHGSVSNGSIDLNVAEAKALMGQLFYAINTVHEIEQTLEIDMPTINLLRNNIEHPGIYLVTYKPLDNEVYKQYEYKPGQVNPIIQKIVKVIKRQNSLFVLEHGSADWYTLDAYPPDSTWKNLSL